MPICPQRNVICTSVQRPRTRRFGATKSMSSGPVFHLRLRRYSRGTRMHRVEDEDASSRS